MAQMEYSSKIGGAWLVCFLVSLVNSDEIQIDAFVE